MARTAPSSETLASAPQEALRAGLVVFAVYHLGLAAFMAFAPHAFFTRVGPFGSFNGHYIRDLATYSAAVGVGFAVAWRFVSWRVPVISVATVQFALHTVNHLIDAGRAHPEWTGWFDFASLLAATLLLAWMWRVAARAREPDAQLRTSSPSPLLERSPT
jgi:hypothetical protein